MEELTDGEARIAAHYPEVYALLMVITRNAAVAEELTQEVFLLAQRKSLRPGQEMRGWLREAARKLALNELRRKRPLALAPEELELAAGAGADTPSADSGPAGCSFEEELLALRQCLRELAESDRRLLAQRYERERKLELIAAEFRQSVGYIKQRLFRLRQRLADCIAHRLAGSEVPRA